MALDAGGEGDVAAGTRSVDRTHAEFVVLLGMKEYTGISRGIFEAYLTRGLIMN